VKFAALAIVAVLAVVQLASFGLFSHVVPHRAGVAFYDAAIGLPLTPPFVRSVAAQVAIEDGRTNDAARAIARLAPGPEREDLEGRLLDAQGRHAAAIPHLVAAGDLVRVSAVVDALDAQGDLPAALTTQRDLVARLAKLGDLEGLAHAQWRLGQLESQAGRHEAALRDYRAALQLVPLSETYLLGAANEALFLGRTDLAARYFERVLALDPASRDGKDGLARVRAFKKS